MFVVVCKCLWVCFLYVTGKLKVIKMKIMVTLV